MKYGALFLMLSFFYHYQSIAQDTESPFNGKIKTVKEATYHAIPQGDSLVRDTLEFSSLTQYSEDGRPIDSKHYNNNGILEEKVIWQYNKFKLPVEIRVIDSSSKLLQKWEFRYDHKNRLVESISVNHEEGINTYQTLDYDELGNMIESNEYNSEDELLTRIKYKYDSLGRAIYKYEHHLHLGDEWQYQTQYDDNNNTKKVIWADASGMIFSITNYTYTYDDNKNWVTQTKVVSERDERPVIRERQLFYFE